MLSEKNSSFSDECFQTFSVNSPFVGGKGGNQNVSTVQALGLGFQCIFSFNPQNNPMREIVWKLTVLKMRTLKHRVVRQFS